MSFKQKYLKYKHNLDPLGELETKPDVEQVVKEKIKKVYNHKNIT